jgi:hypothetical protein
MSNTVPANETRIVHAIGTVPEQIAVSVITAAELELGVLRATDPMPAPSALHPLARPSHVSPASN